MYHDLNCDGHCAKCFTCSVILTVTVRGRSYLTLPEQGNVCSKCWCWLGRQHSIKNTMFIMPYPSPCTTNAQIVFLKRGRNHHHWCDLSLLSKNFNFTFWTTQKFHFLNIENLYLILQRIYHANWKCTSVSYYLTVWLLSRTHEISTDEDAEKKGGHFCALSVRM